MRAFRSAVATASVVGAVSTNYKMGRRYGKQPPAAAGSPPPAASAPTSSGSPPSGLAATAVPPEDPAPPSTAGVTPYANPDSVNTDLVKDGGHYDAAGRWVNSPMPDAVHTNGIAGTINEGGDMIGDMITGTGDKFDHPSVESAPGDGAFAPPGYDKAEKETHIDPEREAVKQKVDEVLHDATHLPDAAHPEAKKYIAASCEEICNDQCTPTGLFSEVAGRMSSAADLAQAAVPSVIRESGAETADYFGDVVTSLIPGVFFQAASQKRQAAA